MSKLTPTELAIIDALVAHNSIQDEVSLQSIARECSVAKSTVVKAVKKLGFSGFQDYVSSYRISAADRRNVVFPEHITIDAFDNAAAQLANLFISCQHCKNLVSAMGGADMRSLGSYISRKLQLFEMFAPVTYDFAAFETRRLNPGMYITFAHQMPSGSDGPLPSYEQKYSSLSHEHGYQIVLFTDTELPQSLPDNVIPIRIAPEANALRDYFSAKVLILFESALAKYSEQINRLEKQ